MSDTYVYNPDDENDHHFFNGVRFDLPSNSATEIKSPWKQHTAEEIAQHLVDRLGKWGVALVSGPVVNGRADDPSDQPKVDEAERKYLAATKEWAEEIVMARAAKNKPRTDVGLPALPATEDETKAEKWLGAKFDAMKAAGLV